MPPSGDGSSIRDRAQNGGGERTGAGVEPQLSIGERDWTDLEHGEELLVALRERADLAAERLAAQKAYTLKDEEVKGLLVHFHLAVGEQARVGEFVIKKTETAGGTVEFERSARETVRIKKEGGE